MNIIRPSSEVPLALRDLYDKVNEMINHLNKKDVSPKKRNVQTQANSGETKLVQYGENDYRIETKFSDGWYVGPTLNKKV